MIKERWIRYRVIGTRAARCTPRGQKTVQVIQNANGCTGCYSRTDAIRERRMTDGEYTSRLARLRAWRRIPRDIRRMILSASGGNRTVIRQYARADLSSRLTRAVRHVATVKGMTMRDIGQLLIESGSWHICGHQLPQQWASW